MSSILATILALLKALPALARLIDYLREIDTKANERTALKRKANKDAQVEATISSLRAGGTGDGVRASETRQQHPDHAAPSIPTSDPV